MLCEIGDHGMGKAVLDDQKRRFFGVGGVGDANATVVAADQRAVFVLALQIRAIIEAVEGFARVDDLTQVALLL